MTITAAMVKELRDKTGAGMLDAKKALTENGGDMDAAVDWLRTKHGLKQDKKAGRVAAEGIALAIASGSKGAVVEVNSETDFVAKNDKFKSFVQELAELVLSTGTTDVETLKGTTLPSAGKPISEVLTELVGTIGENMTIRRASVLEVENGVVGAYVHMGGKIGCLAAVSSSESGEKLQEVAQQVAMHVAANSPLSLDRDSLDPEALEREKTVLMEQARESGKPENVIEKMVTGRLQKFYQENCLVEQEFVMDADVTVKQAVSNAASDAVVSGFVRFGLGEGIEREEEDFASEVAKVANG